uniref:Uncharacterized protein n=1 Tax=Arundo donax TaxID=35708 RepID=A0A0A9C1D4_ARUDO
MFVILVWASGLSYLVALPSVVLRLMTQGKIHSLLDEVIII